MTCIADSLPLLLPVCGPSTRSVNWSITTGSTQPTQPMQQEQKQLAAAFAAGALTAAGVLLLLRPRSWREAVHVQIPHPSWVAPAKQPPPFDPDAMHDIDPGTYPTAELYPLVISAVVPRPIGFAASVSKDGTVNLAPYSYFNVLSHNPFLVVMGICRSPSRGGGKKDTLQNIEETRSAQGLPCWGAVAAGTAKHTRGVRSAFDSLAVGYSLDAPPSSQLPATLTYQHTNHIRCWWVVCVCNQYWLLTAVGWCAAAQGVHHQHHE